MEKTPIPMFAVITFICVSCNTEHKLDLCEMQGKNHVCNCGESYYVIQNKVKRNLDEAA